MGGGVEAMKRVSPIIQCSMHQLNTWDFTSLHLLPICLRHQLRPEPAYENHKNLSASFIYFISETKIYFRLCIGDTYISQRSKREDLINCFFLFFSSPNIFRSFCRQNLSSVRSNLRKYQSRQGGRGKLYQLWLFLLIKKRCKTMSLGTKQFAVLFLDKAASFQRDQMALFEKSFVTIFLQKLLQYFFTTLES